MGSYCSALCDHLTDMYGDCRKYWDLLDPQKRCFINATQAMALPMGWTAKSPSDLRVRIAPGEERNVAQVAVYPAFSNVFEALKPGWQALKCAWTCSEVKALPPYGGVLSGDIALLRLRTPATGKGHSRLPSDSALATAARKVVAFGWGDTDPSAGPLALSWPDLRRTRDNALQLTNPTTLPDCDPDWSPHVGQVQRDMVLCAHSPSTNGGTGKGDSGGPLYAGGADGMPTQIGVTSFGDSKGYPSAGTPAMFANVSKMVKWIRSKTGISGDVASGADNVATALLIDNSGSMSSNDPAVRRRDASKSYVSTAVDGDQIGAVGFESSASTIAPMTRLPAGRPSLLSALDAGIHAGGGTDIGAGLTAACSMLDNATLPAKRAAILLTDGDGGYSNQSSCFSARGWKVFTIGLGSGVNQTLLRQIANDTGGTYQPVPNAASLQCEFQKIRATIAGATQNPCLSDVVHAGQTVIHEVNVASRLSQIAFSSNWPGSDVEMTLVSPTGRRIGRSTTDWDIAHEQGPTHESYVIKVPEPGEWKLELYGADVSAAGEPVSFGANPIPFANALPQLAPSATPTSGDAPLTVSFSANAVDPDGTITNVVWDFGDGTAGSGATATHRYSSGGSYRPTATAMDNDGETTTTMSPPIVVAGQPPTANFFFTESDGRVSVDASESKAPGSTLVRYGWDFNGDGALDVESTDPKTSWPYTAAGDYEITLTVESKTGESALARKKLSITGPSSCTAGQLGALIQCVATSVSGGGKVGAAGKRGLPGAVRSSTRTIHRTLKLPHACSRTRLAVSGRGVKIALAKRLPRSRCRLTLRVSLGASGRRDLLAKRGKRTIRLVRVIQL